MGAICVVQVEFDQGAQEVAIALHRRPRVEGDKGGRERQADRAHERHTLQEIGAGVAFVEFGEDCVVERFDGAGDEGAVGPLQDGEQVAVLEEMLHLDGDVVAEPGPLRVQRFDDGDGVAGAVEEIGVAESDVGGAGGHLAADVLEHDIRLHDAEEAAVDGDHGAVAAEVLAAAGGFGVADAAGAVLDDELRVGAERGQALAVGHQELLAAGGNDGELRGGRGGGAGGSPERRRARSQSPASNSPPRMVPTPAPRRRRSLSGAYRP